MFSGRLTRFMAIGATVSIPQVYADTLTLIIGGDEQAYESVADTVS
jgi:hypothetical protein